jgi:hypothetical protein
MVIIMEKIGSLLNKYQVLILGTISTAVLGFILALLAGPESDYILFINICLTLVFIFLLYRLLFKAHNNYSFLMLSYNLFLIICANHYYSYNELVSNYPALQYIDKSLLYVIVVVILATLFLFLRFISLVSRGSGSRSQYCANAESNNYAEDRSEQQLNGRDLHIQQMQPAPVIDKSRMLSVGAITLVALILFAVICIAIYCFLVLIENNTGVEKIDMYEVVATCTSYGMTLLFIMTAIFFIVVILIELVSYILHKVKVLLNLNGSQASDEYAAAKEMNQRMNYKSGIKAPTYALSIIIFFSLLYLAYKISGHTLQDFFNSAVGGEYLALPLTLLASIIAFFIFVRLIHGILLLTLKAKTLRLEVYIIRIGKLIVSIIYRSIIIVLKFIKFIPDFFEALHSMVLSDEEDYPDDEDILVKTASTAEENTILDISTSDINVGINSTETVDASNENADNTDNTENIENVTDITEEEGM